MKIKLIKGLLGLCVLLIASQANAGTISVNPAVNDILVGEAFTLMVSGDLTGDTEGITNGGGVTMSWNSSQVQLTDSITNVTNNIINSLGLNNWIVPNANSVVVTSNSVTIDVLNFGLVGLTFDLFSLDLIAVPPPTNGPITITASGLSNATSGWDSRAMTYTGAQVNVSAVPVPATAWLFGTGLIGLVGIGRRRILQVA